MKATAQNYKQTLAVVGEKLTFREMFTQQRQVWRCELGELDQNTDAVPKRATVCIMQRGSRVEEPSLARTPFCHENTFLAVGLAKT